MRRAVRRLHTAACPSGALGALDDGEAPARGHSGSWRRRALFALALVGAGAAALAATTLTAPHDAPSSPALPRIDVRRAADLPVADLGWVRMRDHFLVTVGPGAGRGAALGDLLVLADATLAPHASFPLHRHAGVEVVSLVLDGTLTLAEPGLDLDLPAGGAQAIVAGAGIVHAEANRGDRPARMVQVWLASPTPSAAPTYRQLAPTTDRGLAPLPFEVVRPDVQVRQGRLAPGRTEAVTLARGRVGYVLCTGGRVELDDATLGDGDGAVLTAGSFTLTAGGDGPARVLVLELPAPLVR